MIPALLVNLVAISPALAVAPNDPRLAKAKELIDVTDLGAIKLIYRGVLISTTNKKAADPSCAKDPACVSKIKGIKSSLEPNEKAELAKAYDQLAQLIANKYTAEQLDWLLKTYKTPLFGNFYQFMNSKETSAPSDELAQRLRSKIEAMEKASTPTGNQTAPTSK